MSRRKVGNGCRNLSIVWTVSSALWSWDQSKEHEERMKEGVFEPDNNICLVNVKYLNWGTTLVPAYADICSCLIKSSIQPTHVPTCVLASNQRFKPGPINVIEWKSWTLRVDGLSVSLSTMKTCMFCIFFRQILSTWQRGQICGKNALKSFKNYHL